MKKISIAILFFLTICAAQTQASQSPPEDLIQVIQVQQPYITLPLLQFGYDLGVIKKAFPECKVDGKFVTYKNGNNRTEWQLDEKEHVIGMSFRFDPAKLQKSKAEIRLLSRYKDQLTHEAFSHLPSSTRSLVVKDPKEHFEIEVQFPISDYEAPQIHSISLLEPGANK